MPLNNRTLKYLQGDTENTTSSPVQTNSHACACVNKSINPWTLALTPVSDNPHWVYGRLQ